ncbi:hypothetical protein ARTHRO8AJ_460015 [Arthrobacter sp. 8AJ]|nr:hypothetical protein ARTHRO8AJ_460015 [Arthrobacter sp. 8AJ]
MVSSVLLEGVLDLLAGLLQIAFGLVGLALGPQALIACGSACRFLALTAGLLGGVLNLVAQSHGVSSSGWQPFARGYKHHKHA